jgi:two-component system, NarL family, sensor histidine kinase DesK
MKQKKLSDKLITQKTLDKEKILLLIRWSIVISVFIWWWATARGYSSIGIALILVLSSTTLIRMQFSNSIILIFFEELVCFITLAYWPSSFFALVLPAFEAGAGGNVIALIPVPIIILLKVSKANLGVILMINFMAFIIGYIIKAWSDREIIYLRAADVERKQRYELDQLKNELLAANNEMAELVETTERNRIAQQLHDNVGHEIAGALIALQTYKKLEENGDLRAPSMLENVLKRIESSSIKLRETVYQLRPTKAGGALRLQRLCEEFDFCIMKYRFVGEIDRVPAITWVILEPCFKEALTNITKYSKATEVEVRFDITGYIVRMYIKDNGVGASVINSGLGLFGIRERIRAAGGTVAIDGTDGFMLTCILPIDIA